MSDAVATPPDVAIATTREGSLVALMHLPNKLRQVFAGTAEDLARRVASACISEFGMGQDAAGEHAAAVVKAHVDATSPLLEHIHVLSEQLADTQAEHEATLTVKVDLEKRLDEAIAAGMKVSQEAGQLQVKVDELTATVAERDGKIEMLDQMVAQLRAAAAGADVANKDLSPDAGSAAAGTQEGAGSASSQRTDTPPPATVGDGAAAGADGPAAVAASGDGAAREA